MTLNSPEASVRVAWAADAPGIARVQIRAWVRTYDGTLPAEVLASLDQDIFETRWRESLGKPGDARNRVLVAIGSGEQIVGFAVVGPCADPDADSITDGEIEALHVDPEATRQGHGSRLLHAAIDTLRADGFQRAVTWLFSTDDVLREFLTDAGWAPDGAHRELDMYGDGSVRMKQVRLHCAVPEAGSDPQT